LSGMLFASAPSAAAVPVHPGLSVPSMAESVACRTVRSRIVHPNGRVTYRKVRRCHPSFGRRHPRCRYVRSRIVRPNGTVVYRNVRRCR
jgi:hypothetical protein